MKHTVNQISRNFLCWFGL